MRTRAWRNIIAAAYPEPRVRWRNVLGAYLGGVGLNAITPARSGDVLKLFLVKRRVEGSTYPTLAATLVVETLFDARRRDRAPRLGGLRSACCRTSTACRTCRTSTCAGRSSIRSRWRSARSSLGIAIGVLLVWATARVRAFWQRVAAGLRDPPRRRARTCVGVVSWQALSWCFRLATLYWMLRAFHLPATMHNALLAQIAQSLSTLLPITPGGAGTEQGLLLYLFSGQAPRSALLSFSVGTHIAIVVVNVALGVLAIVLLTRSLRLRRLRELRPEPRTQAEAARPTERYGTQSEPRYATGSPGRQRRRKRWIGGCRTIVSSSSSANRRWPRTAASSRAHRLERAAGEVAGEDDVHDVLRRERAVRRDRVDDADRALDGHVLVDAELLRRARGAARR